MKENMKKFLEAAESNEELKAKIAEIGQEETEETVKKMISLAAEYGCTLTKEDFAAANDELSEEELEAVSGGSNRGRQYYNREFEPEPEIEIEPEIFAVRMP